MIRASRILVVDDDAKVRDLIKTVLDGDGHKIFLAGDGEEALSVVAKERPHAVLADVVMPKMDGIELCRRLRKQRNTRFIPLIFLTSEGRVADVIEGFDSGADEYLTKPFTPKELAVRIEQVLNRSFLRLDPLTRLPGYYLTECELARAFRHPSKYMILVVGAIPGSAIGHLGLEELLGLLGEGTWKILSQFDKEVFVGRYDLFRFIGITEQCDIDTFTQNLQKIYNRITPITMKNIPKDLLPKLKISRFPISDGAEPSIFYFKQWVENEMVS